MNSSKPVGIIGAGSFGTAIAQILAENVDVLIYVRSTEAAQQINNEHKNLGVELPSNIKATNDIQHLAEQCTLIFPIVPSISFREMIRSIAPHLRPYHILIHGTKGMDIRPEDMHHLEEGTLTRDMVHTISAVIEQETVVVRTGCLSGPNLSTEIMAGQPTATLLASPYDEVIEIGKNVLKGKRFQVFGSHAMVGAELAGALKNIYALGSGMLGGLKMGKNIQAMLLTRGLVEMVYFAKAFDVEKSAFFGTAGIGDLIATATSEDSRNYSLGLKLGQGASLKEAMNEMPELAEGVRTLKIFYHLSKKYKIRVPITQMLYRVVFENYDPEKALSFLIRYPYDVDVDFL